jgi:hypothetical protein
VDAEGGGSVLDFDAVETIGEALYLIELGQEGARGWLDEGVEGLGSRRKVRVLWLALKQVVALAESRQGVLEDGKLGLALSSVRAPGFVHEDLAAAFRERLQFVEPFDYGAHWGTLSLRRR